MTVCGVVRVAAVVPGIFVWHMPALWTNHYYSVPSIHKVRHVVDQVLTITPLAPPPPLPRATPYPLPQSRLPLPWHLRQLRCPPLPPSYPETPMTSSTPLPTRRIRGSRHPSGLSPLWPAFWPSWAPLPSRPASQPEQRVACREAPLSAAVHGDAERVNTWDASDPLVIV